MSVDGAVSASGATLAGLSKGQRARVVGYADNAAPHTVRRLFDLGLVPGIEVLMIRRAPLRDPAIFRVGDYEIALRDEQSRCILVDLAS